VVEQRPGDPADARGHDGDRGHDADAEPDRAAAALAAVGGELRRDRGELAAAVLLVAAGAPGVLAGLGRDHGGLLEGRGTVRGRLGPGAGGVLRLRLRLLVRRLLRLLRVRRGGVLRRLGHGSTIPGQLERPLRPAPGTGYELSEAALRKRAATRRGSEREGTPARRTYSYHLLRPGARRYIQT